MNTEKIDFKDVFDIKGKNIAVTGASKGIGAGVAMLLAELGANVMLIARGGAKLNAVRQEIESKGLGKAVVYTADLRDVSNIKKCVEQMTADFGHIDVLFNNAGMGKPIPALDVREADWDEMMDLNLKGAFFFAQAVAEHMKNRGGKIINMSSQISVVALENESIYCASKGGINQLTKALALEWAKYGITVNAVGPTFVYTPGTAERLDTPDFYRGVVENIPLNRVAAIHDVAAAVVYLASAASNMVTGQLLLVDGGWTIH